MNTNKFITDVSDISRRSKFIFTNTMICLLKGLEGKRVTVEIRNDFTIQGILMHVDSAMGLNMAKVSMTDVKGKTKYLELFYIQGRNIRYVHIPDEVDIIKTISWELNKKTIGKESERANRRFIMKGNMDRRNKQRSKQQV